MTAKGRRLLGVAAVVLGLAGATALVLTAFQDNLMFFRSPSDLAAEPVEPGRAFRLGGLVAPDSVDRRSEVILFKVTDGANEIAVQFAGLLPDLFREGQGVVAEGRLDAGRRFVADRVFAKHDETYMPPEVADALKRSGHWQEGRP